MVSRIASSLLGTLRTRSDVPMVHFGSAAITAGDLADRIERLASGLRSQGGHQRIGIAMETSPDALAFFIASLMVARETLVLDPAWPDATIAHVAEKSRLDVLVADGNTSHPGAVGVDALAADSGAVFPATGDTFEPVFTVFTSGSTGMPKGCRRSETSWLRSFEADGALADIDGARHGDRSGQSGAFAVSLCGGSRPLGRLRDSAFRPFPPGQDSGLSRPVRRLRHVRGADPVERAVHGGREPASRA
jgi:acyl-CoA synthetase (AMP-forming)/AMP-acid ligase II